MDREYLSRQIIVKSREQALKYLTSFCDKIGMPTQDLLIKLNKVKIELDDNPFSAETGYEIYDNTIYISTGLIQEIVSSHIKTDDINVINTSIKKLSYSILHELVHATRTIYDSDEILTAEKMLCHEHKEQYISDDHLINICDCLPSDMNVSPDMLDKMLDDQNSFEELITECLSYIIYKTYDDQIFSWDIIDDRYNKVKKSLSGSASQDLTEFDISFIILKRVGESGIRSFLNSSNIPLKDDPFRIFFGEQYYELTATCTSVYRNVIKDTNIKESDLKRIKSIK